MNLLDLLEKKNPRIPRKKGQHRGSKSHSDLYTDENPKGTIKGLKFATVKDARASVSKIRNSGRSHAHKIQAAVAMEQRAREMGKTSQAAVYRAYINKMKKKTKKKNEMLNYPNYIKNVSPVPANQKDGEHRYYNPETSKKKKKKNEGWSDKYKKSIDCNNPKGFSQKAHCAGRKKRESVMDKKIAEQKLNLFLEKTYLLIQVSGLIISHKLKRSLMFIHQHTQTLGQLNNTKPLVVVGKKAKHERKTWDLLGWISTDRNERKRW